MKCHIKRCRERERLYKCHRCYKFICWDHVYDWWGSMHDGTNTHGVNCGQHAYLGPPNERTLAKVIYKFDRFPV